MLLTFEVLKVQWMTWDFPPCRLVRSHRRSTEGSASTVDCLTRTTDALPSSKRWYLLTTRQGMISRKNSIFMTSYFHYSFDVTMSFCEVKGTETWGSFPMLCVWSEHTSSTLPLCSNNTSHFGPKQWNISRQILEHSTTTLTKQTAFL